MTLESQRTLASELNAISGGKPDNRINQSSIHQLSLAFRLAIRELRGGIRGFYIFVACLALGVAAIGGIGSLAGALKSGIAKEGQHILGGDISARLIHRTATEDERSSLGKFGKLSEVATMRAMASEPNGSANSLVELKAVDSAYPLYGRLAINDGKNLQSTIREQSGALVEPLLMERLNVNVGDRIKIGDSELTITGLIIKEPDRFSGRSSFGPRVLISLDTMKATGLAQPGSLIRWRYRLKLPDQKNYDSKQLAAIREEIKIKNADSGFSLRDRNNPSPGVNRAIDRLAQFLTLVGLTALLVGGVGIANAVSSFIERKRNTIAVFKCLGAPNSLVYEVYLIQVLVLAGSGILVGLLLATAVPLLLTYIFRDLLPFELIIELQPLALLLAAIYGILVALLFIIWPLGRARNVKPLVLMRDEISELSRRPRLIDIVLTAMLALLLAGIAVLTSDSLMIALYFCAGLPALFVLFLAYSSILKRLFKKIPKPRIPELKLALANLSGPGTLTRSVVLSLGAGLSLLITVSLVDRSLMSEMETNLPENAPDYFVLNIGKSEWQPFVNNIESSLTGTRIVHAPMLRGRIISLNNQPAENIKAPPNVRWVLRGDRGLTYADSLPAGSVITEGEWWPEDHSGEFLVSFEDEIGRGLGLKIGDKITVNVLGRNISARIANFRTVKWESLSINFVMVFSSNTLKAAPARLLATLKLPETAGLADEGRAIQKLTQEFPNLTTIRIQDAIDAVLGVFAKVMVAIRAAGSLTLVAGVLVLAGALATAQRKRIYEAVILKTLGVIRRRVILIHLFEYLILALTTSILAIILGSLSAWLIVTQLMELKFQFSFQAVAEATLLAIVLVMFFGVMGSWRILGLPTTSNLRNRH